MLILVVVQTVLEKKKRAVAIISQAKRERCRIANVIPIDDDFFVGAIRGHSLLCIFLARISESVAAPKTINTFRQIKLGMFGEPLLQQFHAAERFVHATPWRINT